MQQLDRGSGCIGEPRIVFTAGFRHRDAQARTDARATREYRIPHRGREPSRAIRRFGTQQFGGECSFNPLACVHARPLAMTWLAV
jgi:hypothetical protein